MIAGKMLRLHEPYIHFGIEGEKDSYCRRIPGRDGGDDGGDDDDGNDDDGADDRVDICDNDDGGGGGGDDGDNDAKLCGVGAKCVPGTSEGVRYFFCTFRCEIARRIA